MQVRFGDLGWGLGRNFVALDDFRREMDRVFEGHERRGEPAVVGARGLSRVELHDEGDAFVLEAEVPGFEKDELSVSLQEEALTIRGEHRPPKEEGEAPRRRMRQPLKFARTFALPARVDADEVTATLRNGILELRLPKHVEAKARQIQVQGE